MEEPTNKQIMGTISEVKENTQQILEAIGVFSNNVEVKFGKIESRLTKIEVNMVTCDDLDEKLSDLKGDLAVLIRKEDKKLAELVKVLEERKVLSEGDVKRILSMEPYPQS
jgi:hypothetical protein